MATIPRSNDPQESQTLRDVRRWRKEAYDARQRMSPAELKAHDDKIESMAVAMGLKVIRAAERPDAASPPVT